MDHSTSKSRYWTLFSSMFMISGFTFGGGAVIIPLMRKKMVRELGWLTEEEMLDMMAIAQSSPGAVSVNVAAQIGYQTAGPMGVAAATLATVLPPFTWLVLISLFYDSFRTSPLVDAILRSMQPAVAAVILFAAVDMLRPLVKKKRTSDMLLFAAALALGLYGMNVIAVLLFGGVIGAAIATLSQKGGKRHAD